MLKKDELADPKSCLNKARKDELLFVLLERDEDAPATIDFWIRRRIIRGKNKADDAKIIEARELAEEMRRRQKAAKA